MKDLKEVSRLEGIKQGARRGTKGKDKARNGTNFVIKFGEVIEVL